MSVSGIWVVGECRKSKRGSRDDFSGAARRVRVSKGNRVGALADNLGRHEAGT